MLKNILYAILLIISFPALVAVAVVVMASIDLDFRGFNPYKDVSPYACMG
jgi:hypothetical protein